jgi:hypothetical protein
MMRFKNENRGGRRENAGLLPIFGQASDAAPFIAIGHVGDEPLFGYCGFAGDAITAMAEARTAETAALAAVVARLASPTPVKRPDTMLRVIFDHDDRKAFDPIRFVFAKEPIWPYEVLLAGNPLPQLLPEGPAFQGKRALQDRIVRKRIRAILQADAQIARLHAEGRELHFCRVVKWQPSEETSKAQVKFGAWVTASGLPVPLTAASVRGIFSLLLQALPLHRKFAVGNYDRPGRIFPAA